MPKIIIKQVSESGETLQYFRFASQLMAESAFCAFSNDELHQDGNWQFFVDGEMINWHYPQKVA